MAYTYKGAEPLDRNRYIPISDEEAAAKFAYFRKSESQINGGPRRPVTCGTISGYRRHLADKETPCQRCRQAHNDYHRKYRARRIKSGALCGTLVGWRQHVKEGTPKCRKCKDAYNEYHAKWRAKRRQAA